MEKRKAHKSWRDKIEEDLGIMRIKNSQWPETVGNEGSLLEAKVHSGLPFLGSKAIPLQA